MRDNNWYSGLAFGLVAGLILAALLFAFLSAGLPDWWKHDDAVVTTKDTLANWLVAIFSFVAALFLWLTLRATQNMAKDTRRIGEAQVRAYLDVKLAQVEAGEIGQRLWVFRVHVHNRGQSPASQIYVHLKVGTWESFDTVFPDLGAGDHFEGGIQVDGLPDDAFFRTRESRATPLGAIITVRFLDVFHETSPERIERRSFFIQRENDGWDMFHIDFMQDHEAVFKRLDRASNV